MLGYIYPIISIEEILDQPIFLNPHTRMNCKHTPPRNISSLPLWDLCRFLQPGLTSSTIFHKNFTRFSYCQPYKIYKLIIGLNSQCLEAFTQKWNVSKIPFKDFLLQQ